MPDPDANDIHRIGGGGVGNLRLKAQEGRLDVPGISVLKANSPREAARQIRAVFPEAEALHVAATIVGSSTAERIRRAGFDLHPDPTRTLPNHHRIVHRDGASGFNDNNLSRLSDAFEDSTGH